MCIAESQLMKRGQAKARWTGREVPGFARASDHMNSCFGTTYGNVKKQVPNAVQVTGSEKMNFRNVSKELNCNMFGGQKRVKGSER